MKLVIITGPQAVGKMTVGQELAKMTDLKLFHNHMTIDLVSHFFDYGTDTGRRLVGLFRREIFEAVATSDLAGMIFTFVWAFDMKEDWDYIQELMDLFETHGATVCIAELEADVDERLARNRTPNRLEHKPTKRDLAWSDNELVTTMDIYRLNSLEGEITHPHYVRIDNTNLDATETALRIKEHFSL
ncbi:DEAD/DEAH box helicase family protein [Exiguobacterium flavidum]|uniref:AAA family ATPase n=1 Tax=Exiguobacterium flavidum TaxID=2184695 RepID=UPI000DF8588A|nr:AAA family ATPase [Exiguobacterium flavidum]